jgi:hypothetical protein
MSRRLFSRVAAILVALLMLGAAAPSRARLGSVVGPLVWQTPPVREIALPAGFATNVDRATRDQFVGVVAGDVDDDGDLDVVASFGSLDLAIWRNDGAGHFTRLASGRHQTLQTQPPLPSVDGDPSGSYEWIQNGGGSRGADLESRCACVPDDPDSALMPAAVAGPGRFGPRSSPSRAPPLA